MLRVALSQFQSHSRRFIAVGLAVMLSVAFLSTTLMVGASTRASLGASLGEAYRKAELIATPDKGTFNGAALDAVRGVPGVSEAYGRLEAYTTFTAGGQEVLPRPATWLRRPWKQQPLPTAPCRRGPMALRWTVTPPVATGCTSVTP